MLKSRFFLCQGKGGQAACTCRTPDRQYTRLTFRLGRLPLPVDAVAGAGNAYYHTTLTDQGAEWQIPPIDPDDLWLVLAHPTGEVLAWHSPDGDWRLGMGQAICTLYTEQNVSRQTAPLVQFAPPIEGVSDEAAEHEVRAMDDATPAMEVTAPDTDEGTPPPRPNRDDGCDAKPGDTPDESEVSSEPRTDHVATVAPPCKQAANPPIDGETEPVKTAESAIEEHAALGETEPYAAADTDSEPPCTSDEPAQEIPLDVVPEAYRDYFEQCPPCRELDSLIRPSRFVTVRQEDFAYVLGVLTDSDGTPTHLCYGVAGTADRPLADGEYLPLDANRGYWLIYHPLT